MVNNIDHTTLLKVYTNIRQIIGGCFLRPVNKVLYKSENDAVTNVDLIIQEAIFQSLELCDPGVPKISEEEKASVNLLETCWIIDPLDGTSNYLQGLAPSAVSIAKVRGTEILASLTADVITGDVYTAVLRGGVELNGRKIDYVSSSINLMGCSTGYVRSNGHIPQNWNIRVLGSQALQLCHVARGVFGANFSLEAKAWDDVAGALMVREAGGCYNNDYNNVPWVELALDNVSLNSIAVGHQFQHLEKKLRENCE